MGSKIMEEISITVENVRKIKKIEFRFKIKKDILLIVGDNGSGKSTLLACIANLANYRSLDVELNMYYPNGKITYTQAHGIENIWVQQEGKKIFWIEITKNSQNATKKFKGFFEAIKNGTRFRRLSDRRKYNIRKVSENNYQECSEFIKENLEYIINNDKPNYFKNLYYYDMKKEKNRRVYFIKNDNTLISELDFSTGEYFLLSLLIIIDGFKNKKNNDELSLLIIDEIDLALHPLAQKRLIEKLKKWKEDFNLLIIVASHSLVILNEIEGENIYYIQNNKIFNPVYPGYLTSRLYEHTSFDKIILVEDNLALMYIQKILKNIDTQNVLYKIIPIGGFSKVLELQNLNNEQSFYGKAEVVSILDGDVKDKEKNKKVNHNFLPFKNVEYAFLELLQKNDFLEKVEQLMQPKKIRFGIEEIKEMLKSSSIGKIKNTFKEIVEEISKTDKDGKKLSQDKVIRLIFEEYENEGRNKKLEEFLKNFFKKPIKD